MKKRKPLKDWRKVLALACAIAVIGSMVAGTGFSVYGAEPDTSNQEQKIHTDDSDTGDQSATESKDDTSSDADVTDQDNSADTEKKADKTDDADKTESFDQKEEIKNNQKTDSKDAQKTDTSGSIKKDTSVTTADSDTNSNSVEEPAGDGTGEEPADETPEEKTVSYTVKFKDEKNLITINQPTVTLEGKESDILKLSDSDFPSTTDEPYQVGEKEEYYYFDGWYSGSKKYSSATAVTGDVTLEPKWTQAFPITFHADTNPAGGMLIDKGSEVKSMKVWLRDEKDENVIESQETKANDGYELDSWYTTSSFEDGSEIKFDEKTGKSTVSVNKDNYSLYKNIYVKWIELYDVTFKVNYDDGEDGEATVRNGESIIRADIPTRQGYTAEWYTDEACTEKADLTKKITEPQTFYAKWTANKYTVVFDGNGATAGSTESQENVNWVEETEEDNVTIPEYGYTKTGYKPATAEDEDTAVWNTKADGTGEVYKAGETFKNLTDKNGGTVTLYAQWTAIDYTVVFNRNDEADAKNLTWTNEDGKETDCQAATYDKTSTISVTNPARTGYTFAGWDTKSDGTGTRLEDSFINLSDTDNETVTLYAVWRDETEPVITYKSRQAADNSKTLKTNNDIDFSNSAILYTVTITDEGTGVNPETIKYAVVSGDVDTSVPEKVDAKEWKTAEVTQTGEDYTFNVTIPQKGMLLVKAADNADKPSSDDYAIANGKPNESVITKIRTLVLEDKNPEISEILIDGDTADKVGSLNKHTFEIKAKDNPDNGYSGIQSITYTLTKDGEDVKTDTYTVAVPEKLSAIDPEESFAGEIDDPKLNGEYTLSAVATDFAGNTSDSKEVKLNFDNKAPAISLNMTGGNLVGDTYYYNADNCGLTISLDKGKESGESNLDISASKIIITGSAKKEYSQYSPEIPEDGTVIISEEKIRELGDGEITVQVTAVDKAGNSSSLASDKAVAEVTVNGLKHESASETAAFVLDTKAPKIILAPVTEGNECNGFYYYKADNCKMLYSIGEEGDASAIASANVVLKNTDNNKQISGIDVKSFKDGFEENETVGLTEKEITENEITALGDGNIAIEISAKDLAGNESSLASEDTNISYLAHESGSEQASFVLDTSAPQITFGTIENVTGNLVEDTYYYRADNCLFEYSIGDKTDAAPLADANIFVTNEYKSKEITGKAGIKSFVDTFTQNESKKVAGEISQKEMTGLEDGKINVTVTATDLAGNTSTLASDNVTVNGLALDAESGQASFVLDMTAPILIKAITEQNANQDGAGNANNDTPYDNNDFYYKETVTTIFTYEDVNAYKITAGCKKDGEDFKSEKSEFSDTKGTYNKDSISGEVEIVAADEGKYTEFFIEGEDKAGNKLVLAPAKEGTAIDQYNQASVNGIVNNIDQDASEGRVELLYNKIVDKSAPTATIAHTPSATAYMYDKEAYISGKVDTTIEVTDKWALDGSKLTYGQSVNGTWKESTTWEGTETIKKEYRYDDKNSMEEGHYQYEVYGTDRAGNPVTVTETLTKRSKPTGEKIDDKENEVTGNGTSYKPRYELIIDRTEPTYTLDMTKIADASKNVDGVTAYYNKGFRGTFTIDETNFDAKRIGAKVQKDKDNKYYSQSIENWENFGGGLNHIEDTQKYSVSVDEAKDHNTDGVYRFAIQGCDKAGNPLVQSESEKGKSGYQATVVKDDTKGQFWTNKKVLDTIAPELNMTIQNGSKKYYDLTKGPAGTVFDEKIYDPFRSETKATVTFKGEDPSPLNITYGITSTVNGQTRNVTDANTFTDARKLTEDMKGEQVFLPKNIVVTDRAGNVTKLDNANKIYLDVTPPKQDVTAPVATVKASTSITRRSADGRGLYNKAVTLQVDVKDPNPATSSSGLREVTYKVLADGRDVTSQAVVSDAKKTKAGTLVFFSNSSNLPKEAGKNPSLTTNHSFTITLPSGNGKDSTFETNNIRVIVQAVDNAGNKSDPNQGGTVNLGIDTIGPQITVSYDNNSAQNAKYFKNVRYATVRTKERNVDNGKISINTQVGVPGSWSYSAGSDPDGNDDIWTKTLGYTRDGDYTLNISGTDALGNKATVTYTGVAPQAFTIDRTAPVITVTFDNNSAQNGKYYKANRTATVSINEHNFRASDVKISQSATAPRGGSMSSPGASGFSSSGDRRSASIAYTQDGNYRFDVNYTDLAGNPAQVVTVSEFVIDKTAPTLKIENVKENMAYSGEIAPRVVFDDANFSSRLISFLFSGTRVQDHSDLVPSFRSSGAFGGVYDIGNIAVIRKNDDVYTAKATITDLAGNKAEAEITFSVNRFGSTYDYNDDKTTERLMDAYYTNQEKNLIIREINVNALKSHKVTLYRDGSNKVLKEGTDYKVTVGSYGGARQYVYEIFASNFEQEGNYSIIVQSEDEAGNKNTSSTIREDDNVVSALPVEFAVDKTLPEIRAKGASLDSITRYYESGITIYIMPDDNMSLSRVVLVLDGEVIGEYSGKELQKLLEENNGRIPCEIASKASTQILEVTSYDAAGNESGVQTYKVLVTRNILAQFFNRKPLFFGVIAAVVVLLALLYARRKKKSEESEDAA